MKKTFSALSLRMKSLAIFLILVLLVAVMCLMFKFVGKDAALVVFAAVIGVPFLLIARLRCPSCNSRLTDVVNVNLGALLFLFLAKDKCQNCGQDLP
ncbi:MAG: hypothetical protein ACXWIN_04395 [Burkholderiaceae bacterium]